MTGEVATHVHRERQSCSASRIVRLVVAAPIRTKRLTLRPVTQDDVAAVFGILGDQATTANVSWGLSDLGSAQRWVRRRMEQQGQFGLSMWAVELHADGLVGLVGFFLSTPLEY